MEKHAFGRTGYQVSSIGFGGAPIGLLKTEREEVGNVLNSLLDAGVNLIDTAASYQGSEQLIGDAISHRRAEYILVSKCGRPVEGLAGEAWSEDLILRTVDQSLRHLRTDHLDIMLLHTCDLPTLKKGEALGALVKARQAGKIRFAGYSGDNETAAFAATLPDIAALETSINIADQRNIDVVLPAARKHDVGVIAKRPIANAAWKPLSEQPGFYADYAKTYHERLKKMELDPATLGFSGAASDAWLAMALRFTISQPGMHCAIIGTTNPRHVKANIAAAAAGPLPADTIQRIRDNFAKADSSREWTGQG